MNDRDVRKVMSVKFIQFADSIKKRKPRLYLEVVEMRNIIQIERQEANDVALASLGQQSNSNGQEVFSPSNELPFDDN